jgi:catechol 2,3-dioxygenase-like lactoylglutathione lyase family enzyme
VQREDTVAKIRHIAIATKDPEKTAKFYRDHFEMEEVGRTSSKLAEGIYLSDGTVNMAVLNFKTDQLGKGTDYVGLHHFGFVVEDVDKLSKELEDDGAPRFEQNDHASAMSFFELKHRGPDGVVFDLSAHPWVGSAGLEDAQVTAG